MPVLFHVTWCSSYFCNNHLLSYLKSSIIPLCVDRHFSISTFHSYWKCSVKQVSDELLPSSILSNAQTKSTWRSHIWSTVTTQSCSYRSTSNGACSGQCIRQAHTWVLKVNKSTGYRSGWGYTIWYLLSYTTRQKCRQNRRFYWRRFKNGNSFMIWKAWWLGYRHPILAFSWITVSCEPSY